MHEVQRAEIRQRERRADRQVDAADDHDQRHAEHDENRFPRLRAGIRELAADRKSPSIALLSAKATTDQHDHRYRRLGPALGENLAQHVVRPVAITEPDQRAR